MSQPVLFFSLNTISVLFWRSCSFFRQYAWPPISMHPYIPSFIHALVHSPLSHLHVFAETPLLPNHSFQNGFKWNEFQSL